MIEDDVFENLMQNRSTGSKKTKKCFFRKNMEKMNLDPETDIFGSVRGGCAVEKVKQDKENF